MKHEKKKTSWKERRTYHGSRLRFGFIVMGTFELEDKGPILDRT